MRLIRYMLFAVMAAALLAVVPNTGPAADAQVTVGIGVGAAPVCPYGYYDFAPYNCAPYGYYGPEWFNGGVFIGAGPWFHGEHGFHGHVDNRYDPRHGYHGPYPEHSDQRFNHFHGNETRDGQGHESHGDEHGGEHR